MIEVALEDGDITNTLDAYPMHVKVLHLGSLQMKHDKIKPSTTSPIQPISWYRKVDDTRPILKQDQDPALLLQHLNQQHPRVQITIEIEKTNQLPFLDVLVSRTQTNRIYTSVYRKPTHTDQNIHFNSNHPLRTKTGIISTHTKRAINLSTADPKPEIKHLRQVSMHLNNYPLNLVDKVISSVLHPTPRSATLKPESAPFRIGKSSHIISRLLKQQANIDTFFTSSTLHILLRARTQPNPKSLKVQFTKLTSTVDNLM
ncbi:uncharacterized protein LOC125381071 [Haliotis rufescens]|uniref:uncharacterized protein LOC125381071 n=1 Tax=Haliotis rufescens TaxID=6454 RepID=UPI00201FA065|nr:uncharacterized protein LOC125381071 [Haliotis rufescens]